MASAWVPVLAHKKSVNVGKTAGKKRRIERKKVAGLVKAGRGGKKTTKVASEVSELTFQF